MVKTVQQAEHEITGMNNDQLLAYMDSVDGHFSDYSSLYNYKTKHPCNEDYYRTLFSGIEFKTFLDLGPGVGDSLEVARSLGAKTYFVDRDIFIIKYNENNGHECFPMDYFKPELPNIGRYDLVLSRGSLNLDMMNRTNFDIDNLLNWIVSLGEKVIIIPTWDKGELVRGEDYTCEGEHLYTYLKSMVHDSFLNHGFGFVVDQENLRFPITYKNF